MAPIERITLFKIANEADRDRLLEQYKIMAKTAVKVCSVPRLGTYITRPEDMDWVGYLVNYRYADPLQQDGKPYILQIAAGASFPDPRNQGYNLSVKTTFASLEDMKYYDEECAAHKALKAVGAPLKPEVLTTYFESVL